MKEQIIMIAKKITDPEQQLSCTSLGTSQKVKKFINNFR